MKHLLLFPFALLALCASAQRDHHIEVEPAIEQLTVYLNGGEVRTSKDVDLVAGRNVVLVKGLSPHLHPQSVQATVKGSGASDGPRILSVSSASNFLDAGKLEPRIVQLRDSVHLLNDRITDIEDHIAASEAEKEMLSQNHDIGGNSVVVTAEQLAKAADFFRERTLMVNRAHSKLNKEQVQFQEQLARVEQQLSELNYRHNPERKEVTIVVLADKAQRAHLDLRYLVANTGWAPIYDLVAKDNSGPVQLRYKAQVYNNTGLDWNDVRLVLSTADPSLGASKPELDRWVLNYNTNSW
ncbi:MAG TPA: mucoidy inhibitor MuiA family protein, partial [Flavobacteriales bacterium]|nr:mucoidy inhibitor MuiA family protein [Flavobacteriales bacterium]